MRSFLRLSRSMAVALFVAAPLAAQPLPEPGNAPVAITNAADVAQLAGRGVAAGSASSAAAFDRNGNEIVWREVRSGTDSLGARHTFYRQYLVSNGVETELFGSEIGMHYTKAGALRSILGHQFRDVVIANRASLKAADAVERAVARLQHHPGFRAERAVNASDRAYRTKNAQLKLVQTDRKSFRYTWFTLARNHEGVEHNVAIDAQTEEVLSVTDLHKGSNCHPSSPWSWVSASGHPVRPDLRNNGVRRSIRANVTNDRPWPYTREGYWNGTPNISITQETTNSPFFCFTGVPASYTLFPVGIDSGVATYRDRGDGFMGYAAGDAMYNSRQTMMAFSTLGRAGWDGNYGDSNVVIESTYLGNYVDVAFFRMSGNNDPRVPITPFMGIAPAQDYYHPGASLDHIAHEWGHGVIFTSANFPTTTIGLQMHEGWADVIGTAVEKLRQPAGTGLEQNSDWTMHEDTAHGGYARGAIDDGTSGHIWVGINLTSRTYNDRLHKDDAPSDSAPHAFGNMLQVVYRLMAEGGKNPVCVRQPGFAGCNVTSNALGATKAAQILFDTVTWYTPSTAQWADLAEYATYAAFDRYNQCDYLPTRNAPSEQSAVNAAFTAIGYPRLIGTITCQ
ncbi:MAG TPA: M4 family metallopeptidase [Thermoanaerobaculia bacterium]